MIPEFRQVYQSPWMQLTIDRVEELVLIKFPHLQVMGFYLESDGHIDCS